MATLDKITAAVSALDAKVSAHLDADGAAVLELTNANAALQQQVLDLKAALENAGATPEQVDAVVAAIEAIGVKL